MRLTLVVLGLLAMTACNRDAAPLPQAQAEKKAEKAAPSALRRREPAIQAPVAEDTTRDAATHTEGSKIEVVLTALQGVGPLESGARVTARFAGAEARCTLHLQRVIAAGQGSEASMICKEPLRLSGGAFDFTVHANGQHVADGVVLQ